MNNGHWREEHCPQRQTPRHRMVPCTVSKVTVLVCPRPKHRLRQKHAHWWLDLQLEVIAAAIILFLYYAQA
jgi:hypothetical protein